MSKNKKAIELLTKWLNEDPYVECDEEFEELKLALDKNRFSERKLFEKEVE